MSGINAALFSLDPEETQKLPSLSVHRKPAFRIRQAVRDNNVNLLQRLQYKHNLRNTDQRLLTSLAWAAIESNLEAFEWLLLDYGHDDQELSRDDGGNTILHMLASTPTSPHQVSPYTQGSSPHLLPTPAKPIELALHNSLSMTSTYLSVFPYLVDWSNTGGKTALHIAAQAGHAGFIALLIDHDADVDLTDQSGNTPLHYAAAWGNMEAVRTLLQGGSSYNKRNFDGFTAADFALTPTVTRDMNNTAKIVVEERARRRQQERVLEEQEGRGLIAEPEMLEPHDRYAAGWATPPDVPEKDRKSASRLRSGSVSTGLSVGSGTGSALSNNSKKAVAIAEPPTSASSASPSRPSPLLAPPTLSTQSAQHHPEASRVSSGSSRVKTASLPPSPSGPSIPLTVPSVPTAPGRPQQVRSPSSPAPAASGQAGPAAIPALAPPLGTISQGSVPLSAGMRRARSSQTGSGSRSGSEVGYAGPIKKA